MMAGAILMDGSDLLAIRDSLDSARRLPPLFPEAEPFLEAVAS
jgi:hypothetical protein